VGKLFASHVLCFLYTKGAHVFVVLQLIHVPEKHWLSGTQTSCWAHRHIGYTTKVVPKIISTVWH
jgi:hypothetical protein